MIVIKRSRHRGEEERKRNGTTMKNDNPNQMREFFDQLRDGECFQVIVEGADIGIAIFPMSHLSELLGRPGIVALLGLLMRPGVAYLQRRLELIHFPPGTPAHNLLERFILKWQGMLWSLMVFPGNHLTCRALKTALDHAGLVVAAGIPTIGGKDVGLGAAPVPSGNPSLFSRGSVAMDMPMDRIQLLENQPGHLVYRDPLAAHRRELEMIVELEQQYSNR